MSCSSCTICPLVSGSRFPVGSSAKISFGFVIKALAAAKGLKEEFAKIVEDFDRDRVHDNDVKKLFTWYNILVDNGFTKFAEIEEEKEAEKSDAPAEEE